MCLKILVKGCSMLQPCEKTKLLKTGKLSYTRLQCVSHLFNKQEKAKGSLNNRRNISHKKTLKTTEKYH